MHRNAIDKQIAEFCHSIKQADDVEVIKKLFSEMFTEPELNDLALRWKLLKMLQNGISQRKIAVELGISLCKITRGAKLLKDRKSVIGSIIKHYA